MNKFFCAVLVVLLVGCATGSDGRFVGAGGGSYEYQRTMADGSTCSVSVVSGRDVQGGALSIDKDCAVSSKADGTAGAVKALDVINDGIAGMREAVSKIP